MHEELRKGPFVLTIEHIDKGMKGIKTSKCCRGVPYAALITKLRESRLFHLQTKGWPST